VFGSACLDPKNMDYFIIFRGVRQPVRA